MGYCSFSHGGLAPHQKISISINIIMEINDTTKDIINAVADGSAFSNTMKSRIDSLATDWQTLDQNNLFGNRSPLHGILDDVVSTAPIDQSYLDTLDIQDRNGAPITLANDVKQKLLGKPRGALSGLSVQMGDQINNIVDSVKIFSAHQSVLNSLGEGQNCSSMESTFGSIASFGQQVSNIANQGLNALNDFKALKTQLQSEITNFDSNVIGILSGHINGTILSNLVVGSGLNDQIDKIIVDSGIGANSAEALQIRQDVGALLSGNTELVDYFVTKNLTLQNLQSIRNEAGEIIRQIGTEKITLDNALTKLKRVSDGLTMLGLFKSNPCVQTIVGFNGTDDFISKLGSA